MITLQFATERGWTSRLIRWFTWSRYSHVDFVLPVGRLLGARLSGGVAARPGDYATFTRVERFTVKLNPEAEDQVAAFAISQIGKPYDWRSLFGFLFRRDWREPDSWFCSELVAAAFEYAGKPLLRARQANRITPEDLLLSPLLQEAPCATPSASS